MEVNHVVGGGGEFGEETCVGAFQAERGVFFGVFFLERFAVRPEAVGVDVHMVGDVGFGAESGRGEGGDGDDGAAQVVDQFLGEQFVEDGWPGVFGAVDAGGEPDGGAVFVALREDDGEEFGVAGGVVEGVPASILDRAGNGGGGAEGEGFHGEGKMVNCEWSMINGE